MDKANSADAGRADNPDDWDAFAKEADERLTGHKPAEGASQFDATDDFPERSASEATTETETETESAASSGAPSPDLGEGESPASADANEDDDTQGATESPEPTELDTLRAERDRLAQTLRSEAGRIKKAQLVLRKQQFGELDDLDPEKVGAKAPTAEQVNAAVADSDPEALEALREEFPAFAPLIDSLQRVAKQAQDVASRFYDREIADATTEADLAYADAIESAHADFRQVVQDTKFREFVDQEPARVKLFNSDDPTDNIYLISEFKRSAPRTGAADTGGNETRGASRERLAAAADPLTPEASPRPKTVDPDDAAYWDKYWADQADRNLAKRGM